MSVPVLIAAFLAGPGAVGAREAEAPPRLDVRAHARAFVAGELVRIVVRSAAPVEHAAGTFGADEVTFVKRAPGAAAGGAQPETWDGWAVIDLDAKPGEVVVEARAVAAAGGPLAGRTAVRVSPKAFPEERLKVAGAYVAPPEEAQARIARDNQRLAKVYALRSEQRPSAAPFVRPVAGEPTAVFGSRRIFNGERRAPHSGLDLRAATGTPVAAAGPGLAVLVHDLYFSGITVILDHGGGLFTIYAHLSEARVAEGASVAAGDVLGLSGATGRVTGPHLHWGGKVGKRIFDPTALLDPALFPESPTEGDRAAR